MTNTNTSTDVILIGAGIMSATLGTILKQVEPSWNITLFETLETSGEESSNAWNNAGTGHSALCELNYTTERKDGTMDITKALNINEQFQVSKQFWSYLVENGLLENPKDFIHSLPHMSLVFGEDNVKFLKKRYEALIANPLFKGMEFSDSKETLENWLPLIMAERPADQPIAATRMDTGTDVNFGALTNKLLDNLALQGVNIQYNSSVEDFKEKEKGVWEVKVRNSKEGSIQYHTAKHIFIGAGGGALPLLQKTGIPESKHIGGFPVSGLFLVCKNEAVIQQHNAKVYGKADIGAPPMSVPHLDTRYIDGKRTLLFGPFAGFSPKFLKSGSNLDLVNSVKPNNVLTMLAAGAKNMSLTKYLVSQLLLSKKERIEELRKYVPDAKEEDWDVVVAGQRVQVIKDTDKGKGTLQFGTEVVTSKDGSISALLGASPGASTAVHVMLNVIERCFPENISAWEAKIKEMVPSYGLKLQDHPELIEKINKLTSEALELKQDLEPTK